MRDVLVEAVEQLIFAIIAGRNLDRYVQDVCKAMPERSVRHAYRAHKQFPWFCGICGYPKDESQQHD